MKARTTVVIPNWNGERLLPACLRHLTATEYDKLSVVVVDNGSKDGSRALIARDFPKARVLALPSNLGFAKACNIGVKHALAEDDAAFVVLLNNDAETRDPTWLRRMIDVADRDPTVGVVGCRLVFPDGRDQELGRRLTLLRNASLLDVPGWTPPAEVFEVDAVIGAVFLMTRRVIETIGLLDEGFFLGLEDIDYCVRARRAGFRVKMTTLTSVVHHRSQSIGLESYLSGYPLDRKTEVRYRLINNAAWTAPLFLAGELRFLAAHLFPRDGAGRSLSPDWKAYLSGFVRGYLANLKDLPDILYKRYHRSGRQWY